MVRFFLFFTIFLLTSCGGGGGGGSSTPVPPFSITVNSFSISTDEDISYSGTLSATTNETTTVTFEAVTTPTSGSLTISSSGSYEYIPTLNFNGTDSFSYRALATLKSKNSSEATVSITVNAVDDAPLFSIDLIPTKDEIIILEDGKTRLNASVSDIDSDLTSITYSATINGESFPLTKVESDSLILELDLNSLIDAGRFVAEIKACSTSNACDSLSFETFFTTGLRTEGAYKTYNLMGSYELGSTNRRNIDMMILADSLDSENLADFRSQLTENINSLIDGSVSDYFDGFFNVLVVEPEADATSSIDFTADGVCSDFSETTYCWDVEKLSDLKTLLFPEISIDETAILTSLAGRGVSRSSGFAQGFGNWRNSYTFRHELGHAHAVLGDEYDSDGEREYNDAELETKTSYYTNLTTKEDPSNVAWKHLIQDLTNVPGYHQNAGNAGIGHFEGTYFKNTDTYRPYGYSLMGYNRCKDLATDGCGDGLTQDEIANLNYLPQFAESFSLSSIIKMISSAWGSDTSFISETQGDTTTTTGLKMGVGINSDQQLNLDLYSVEWSVDYVKDNSKTDQGVATFDRPATNKWVSYTWKIVDKSGFIAAPDNISNATDCYEGRFEYGFAAIGLTRLYDGDNWANGPEIGVSPNTQEYDNYKYGYHRGCGAGTFMVNWKKY